ncbi:MAG: recombinase family protein [Pseudomonadota bacterium]
MKSFIYCRKSQEAEDRQVLSLESQLDEIQRLLQEYPEIEIVDVYSEAKSAKKPGRPLFNKMMKRIQKGEAECIVAWHPDRLARNSVDGGQVIYFLDEELLVDLKFCTYTFENSPEGKFMLSIMFGQSKYTIDNLSKNVLRGIRKKLAQGWLPNRAPLGFVNDRNDHNIKLDHEHAAVIRKIFDWFLSGLYTVAEIHRKLIEELDYRTPIRKKSGGKRLSRSQVYRILANPFYAGYLPWKGELYEGKHEAIISKDEFLQVQKLLGRQTDTRKRSYDFLFKGLFSCGVCGKAVTAERKQKPSGKEYIYYHCTRVHNTVKCKQPSVEERPLICQLETFLESLKPTQQILKAAQTKIQPSKFIEDRISTKARLESDLVQTQRQLTNLTDLRLRDVVTDEEFTQKRFELGVSLETIKEKLADPQFKVDMFEPVQSVILLFDRALFFFRTADHAGKRRLLKLLCSNSTLKDKTALFQLAFP